MVEEHGDGVAGGVAAWVVGMQAALRGERDAAVPCGTCTACCTSSQFVHIGPEETATLARIPRRLQFQAPGLPRGHVVLGYDDEGRCPMFVDGGCSIYEDRPRTCRTYDCRIFAATGVAPEAETLPLIAAQAARWDMTTPTTADRVARDALQAAAAFLSAHGDELRDLVPPAATPRAVLAVALHEVFVERDAHGAAIGVTTPTVAQVRDALAARPGATRP